MKKKILMISIVLMGFFLVFTGHAVAASKKGGHYPKWDKPAGHHYAWNRAHHTRGHHYLARHRHGPKHFRRHHLRAHRHGYYRWFRGRPQPTLIRQVNNYYNSDEGDSAPQDSFNVDASVSDTGVSFSFGVSIAE